MQKGFVSTASITKTLLKTSLPWFKAPSPSGDLLCVDFASELKLLREWVTISSPSNDRAGVEEMQKRMRNELEQLGFACHFVNHPENRFADFLVAELKGELSEFITLICHTDTVLPSQGFRVSDDGKQAYGSGVIDNKGGLVVLISALKKFLDKMPKLKYSLRVLCSPNEEVGSLGFIPVYLNYAHDTRVVLGLEPALANGSIICQRRGNRWYNIEVSGREAHAGRSRGEHANAAHDLAKKIVALQALNNPRREIAVNVGYFQGGQDRHNIICGKAFAKLDVRFSTLEDRDWLHKKIEAILALENEVSVCGRYKSQSTYEIVDDCPPVAPSKKAVHLSESYIATIERLERRVIRAEAAGGAGDVNYLSRKGVVVLDGFGAVGGEMHTKHEFVDVLSLGARSSALANFLETIQST